MTTKLYRLPPTFYWDHASRDLPAGEVERETKTAVFARLTQEEVAEIRSDADFYAHETEFVGFPGLRASARATIRAIDKQNEAFEVERLKGRTMKLMAELTGEERREQ